MPSKMRRLQCPVCGCVHRAVPLATGHRAQCVRCGETLAYESFFGRDGPLAFALSALVLFVPAMTMPIVTMSKFGSERTSRLVHAVSGLWRNGMPELAVWVLFCGIVAPVVLLALIVLGSPRPGSDEPFFPGLNRVIHALQEWAMPEVQVLAVLVAFLKLGDLVEVKVGAGLWCYGAMTLCLLGAWRGYSSIELDEEAESHDV